MTPLKNSYEQFLPHMKSCLCLLLFLSCALHADDAQLPPDAQRAMKEYDATMDGAKKRLVAQLQTVMQTETTRGHLDAALAVRNKIAELAPGTGAIPAATPAPALGAAPGVAEQVFVIEARDDKGTLIGPGKKGQRVHAQYVEGLWVASAEVKISPDEPKLPMHQAEIIGITAAGEEVIALIPAGTKRHAFSEALKKDYSEVRLRSHDGTRNDNSGSVKYKAAIR